MSAILYVIAGSAVLASVVMRVKGREREYLVLVTAGLGLLLADCLLQRAWPGAGVQAAVIALILGSDWWNKRGRKVVRQFGAKAKAARDAIVRRAREAGARPPVPQGAGA